MYSSYQLFQFTINPAHKAPRISSFWGEDFRVGANLDPILFPPRLHPRNVLLVPRALQDELLLVATHPHPRVFGNTAALVPLVSFSRGESSKQFLRLRAFWLSPPKMRLLHEVKGYTEFYRGGRARICGGRARTLPSLPRSAFRPAATPPLRGESHRR